MSRQRLPRASSTLFGVRYYATWEAAERVRAAVFPGPFSKVVAFARGFAVRAYPEGPFYGAKETHTRFDPQGPYHSALTEARARARSERRPQYIVQERGSGVWRIAQSEPPGPHVKVLVDERAIRHGASDPMTRREARETLRQVERGARTATLARLRGGSAEHRRARSWEWMLGAQMAELEQAGLRKAARQAAERGIAAGRALYRKLGRSRYTSAGHRRRGAP